MTLYLAVTADRYELPMLVSNDLTELAKNLGKSKGTVSSCLTRNNNTRTKLGLARLYKVDINQQSP